MKKIAIAAGGTGGHFYPGYVLAQALASAGHSSLFLLRRQDPAAAVLDREGIPFVEVDLRGLPRRPGAELLRFAPRLLASLRLIGRVLRDWRADCVVGMGGYLTFPAVWSAWRLRLPSLVHESNAVLGLANRACLPAASRLALGLPLLKTPKRPFLLCGTPVRPELWSLPEAQKARRELGLDPQRFTLLVFGGSQGARRINQALPEALLPMGGRPFQCLHICGDQDVESVRAAYASAPFKALVLSYLHEMDKAYAAADLVVCRAGASTLAELIASRRPALLIPYAAAAADHQEANARLLENVGAALRIPESELGSGRLSAALGELMPAQDEDVGARERLAKMSGGYGRLGLPSPRESARMLAEAVEGLCGAGS